MAPRVEGELVGSAASPYWCWLLVALLLHAALILWLNTKLVLPAQIDVSSGENATEVSLEAAEEPLSPPVTPSPASPPIPASQPTPASLPVETPIPPKPDDIVVPKAATTPSPLPLPVTPKPTESTVHASTTTHSPSSHPDIKHSRAHHETHLGGQKGSAVNGKATYLLNPDPPYPEEARDAQIQGRVELMVCVDETGRVTAVRLLKSSGEPSLDQSALHTVRTLWKFNPARAAGIPVPSQVLVPISFRLFE